MRHIRNKSSILKEKSQRKNLIGKKYLRKRNRPRKFPSADFLVRLLWKKAIYHRHHHVVTYTVYHRHHHVVTCIPLASSRCYLYVISIITLLLIYHRYHHVVICKAGRDLTVMRLFRFAFQMPSCCPN